MKDQRLHLDLWYVIGISGSKILCNWLLSTTCRPALGNFNEPVIDKQMLTSSYRGNQWANIPTISMGTISHDSTSQTCSKRKISKCAPTIRRSYRCDRCTHVAILAPKVHEEAYVNHNGYHSINVQMVHIIVTLCMRNRDIFIYPLLIHNAKLFYRYVIQIQRSLM